MDKLAAFSRLAPVPLHLHVNAVRFCWALCALLALRGICADILRKKNNNSETCDCCALSAAVHDESKNRWQQLASKW